MISLRIDAGTPECATLVHLPFCTMDPGMDGAVIFYPTGSPEWHASAVDLEACADGARNLVSLTARKRIVVVREKQFVKNPKQLPAVIDLIYTSGLAVGSMTQAIHGHADVVVVDVAPTTWQSWQHRKEGRRKEPGSGGKLALEVAQRDLFVLDDFSGHTKDYQTGLAAAFGIAGWWLDTKGKAR